MGYTILWVLGLEMKLVSYETLRSSKVAIQHQCFDHIIYFYSIGENLRMFILQ